MQKFKITLDNPDGSLETVWEKKATVEAMNEKFLEIIKNQQKERNANPSIAWRTVRLFDEFGNQIRHES